MAGFELSPWPIDGCALMEDVMALFDSQGLDVGRERRERVSQLN